MVTTSISSRIVGLFLFGTIGVASARHRQLLTTSTENELKLVLTPASTELTDAAKQSFVSLFDEAMVRYIGLHQSLSHPEDLEYHVDAVDTAITSQLVESTFLLGSGTTTRGRSRQLLDGVSTGSIISSLNMELLLSASFVVAAGDSTGVEVPDLQEYATDFFAEDSGIASSFVDACQHILDEYGKKPLSGLQAIGVEKNVVYDGPYSYLDSTAVAAASGDMSSTTKVDPTNNAASDRENVRESSIAGAAKATQVGAETSNSIHWMWVVIAGGGVAAIALSSLFVAAIVRRGRNKGVGNEAKGQMQNQRDVTLTSAQQKKTYAVPLSVLNCNGSLPSASPMSFDGQRAKMLNGPNYASNSVPLHEKNDRQRHAVWSEEQVQLEDNEVTTPRSTWTEPFLSFAKSVGFGDMVQGKESMDEDSKGNEIPNLALPPREFRKKNLAQQKESASISTKNRSAVEELLGNGGNGRKGRVTPKDGRHSLYTNRGEDLYVIPEDDASL